MTTADTPAERLRENIVGIVSVLVTATWMGAMFTDQEWWLAALLIGYIAVVPITAMLFGDEEEVSEHWGEDALSDNTSESAQERQSRDSKTSDDSTDAALQTLRKRYAQGELTEAQFERKLERLLEVETVEDLEGHIETAKATGSEEEPEQSVEAERERN
jgi:hypothetical protein